MTNNIADHTNKVGKDPRRSRDFLDRILNGMYEGLLVIDHDFTIVDMNVCFKEQYSNTPGGMIGRKCYEITHRRQEPCTGIERLCPVKQVFNTGKPARTEHIHYKNLNTKLFVELHAFPLFDEYGEVEYVVELSNDITERKRTEEKLEQSREQLRNFTAHLQAMMEAERTNIAREIHDELSQVLTGLKMDLSFLNRKLTEDQKPLREKIKLMNDLIDSTVEVVQRISTELRLVLLDDPGLVAAIEWEAEEFQNRTGIKCKINVHPEDIELDQDHATAVYRIFKESLNNIVRHARADRVNVKLEKHDNQVYLEVNDNGVGIKNDELSDPKSFGLMGIRERANYLGGKVDIQGEQGKGTSVKVNIPINKPGETA